MIAEYDEEDDGFAFTRTRSKRAKAAAEPSEPTIQEKPKPAATKGSRKKSIEVASPIPVAEKEPAPRRRITRNSGEKIAPAPEPAELHVPKKRSKQATSRAAKTRKPDDGQKEAEGKQIDLVGSRTRTPVAAEVPKEPTKIALPFADTPIIRRNQEMRKGSDSSRRSSLSMRGRRASSLIDSGTSNGQFSNLVFWWRTRSNQATALPHDEVPSSEFYKHIESGLLEPRRMRQLLIWCGTRALNEKPPARKREKEDPAARLAGEARRCMESLEWLLTCNSPRDPTAATQGLLNELGIV